MSDYRPCRAFHPEPTTDGRCRVCYLFVNDERYRKVWTNPPAPPRRPHFAHPRVPARVQLPQRPPCPHEGEVSEHGAGENCHVRRCNHPDAEWDRCKRGAVRAGSDVQSCEICLLHPDAPKPLPPLSDRRHLLYHLLPVAGNDCWQRNLDQLKWRLPLFTGHKIIAVCTGTGPMTPTYPRRPTFTLDPPEAVEEYLRGTGCEILTFPNDVKLREVVTWGPLWDRLREFADTDDAVFYAQGKGVTQPFNPGVTVHPWTRVLYSSLLDFWPVVADVLSRHPIAGSLKKVGFGFQGSRSTWHYSGSFFWIRAREAFRHGRVADIDRVWWGNEAWPGLHFRPDEAGVVFKEGTVPDLDWYEPRKVYPRYLPEFRAWCGANAHRRTACLTS